MANNRMVLVCKDCQEGIALAKYYPKGTYIGGPDEADNSGWYANKHIDRLNDFFVTHTHGYDSSPLGGSQYYLGYEDDGKNWRYA